VYSGKDRIGDAMREQTDIRKRRAMREQTDIRKRRNKSTQKIIYNPITDSFTLLTASHVSLDPHPHPHHSKLTFSTYTLMGANKNENKPPRESHKAHHFWMEQHLADPQMSPCKAYEEEKRETSIAKKERHEIHGATSLDFGHSEEKGDPIREFGSMRKYSHMMTLGKHGNPFSHT
jgi:hypothetical protein